MLSRRRECSLPDILGLGQMEDMSGSFRGRTRLLGELGT